MRVRISQSGAVVAQAPEPNVFHALAPTFEVGARTDVGRRRDNNEDSFSVAPELGLFVLSDGMGGEAAGEMASKIAVEEVTRHMKELARNADAPLLGEVQPQLSLLSNQLGAAVRRANRIIWEAAQHHASQRGMGATVVVAALRMPLMSIGHVGDSRIYLLRGNELQQLTEDHSLVMEQVRRGLITREEAEKSDMANIIIRALGADDSVNVDLDEVVVMPGDRVILCSDGLTKMVPDSGIAQVVSEAATPQQACDRLVEIANECGGDDNITVVVVALKPPPEKTFWGWLKSLFS